MSNVQLYFAIGIPMILVLISYTVTVVQISGVKDDIRELRADVREIRSNINLSTGKVIELMERQS